MRVHSALDRTPFRVPHHLPAVRPVGRTDSPEVSAPCDDITRTSPVWSGVPSTPTPVPPAGFRNLPAVSWQIRACGPVSCRYRPWATSPFRALPGRDRVTPSRGRWLPCGHPRATCARRRGLVTTGFTDAFLIAEALAGIPPRLWAPFQRATHGWLASWSPWTARSGLAPDHADHPLRSFLSLCQARAADPAGFPAGAAVLSWAFRPSRAFSPRPSDPLADPPRPRSAALTGTRLLAHRRATSGTSRPPGRVNQDRQPVKVARPSSSTESGPVWTGPCHLFGGSPSPTALNGYEGDLAPAPAHGAS